MKIKTTWRNGLVAGLVVTIAYATMLTFDANGNPNATPQVYYGSDMTFNYTPSCPEEADIISIPAILVQNRSYLPKNAVSETADAYAGSDKDTSGIILLRENEFSDYANLKLYILSCQDFEKLTLVANRNKGGSPYANVGSGASDSQGQAQSASDSFIWNTFEPELEQAGWTSLRPLFERIAELIIGILLIVGAFKTGKAHLPFTTPRRSIRHICDK